tara:strand:+ start:175 stop:366 length:192 start_codon:yes stop_codon:yes gene_type:complete
MANVAWVPIPMGNNNKEICPYCEGNCPNEPEDSEWLCDGYAGDIDNLVFRTKIGLSHEKSIIN